MRNGAETQRGEFRITMNPQYLQSVKELVSTNNNLYTILTNKMLLMDYNRNDKCFFYCKLMFKV